MLVKPDNYYDILRKLDSKADEKEETIGNPSDDAMNVSENVFSFLPCVLRSIFLKSFAALLNAVSR